MIGLSRAGAPTSTLQPSNLGACGRRTTRLISSSSALPLPATAGTTVPFKQEMLEPAMLIGLGAVAVWTYVNHPRLRPSSLLVAVLHVVVSFAGFALLPALLSVLLPLLPSRTSLPYVVLALLIPFMTYVLLSWVWLIARILHDISGTPRGGHPISAGS